MTEQPEGQRRDDEGADRSALPLSTWVSTDNRSTLYPSPSIVANSTPFSGSTAAWSEKASGATMRSIT